MPGGAKFATGKFAWGVCDQCGFTWMLNDLRETTIRGRRTGMLMCPDCWDPDHPQNFLPEALVIDPEALRNPRPQDDEPSRKLKPVFLVPGVVGQFAVGKVEAVST